MDSDSDDSVISPFAPGTESDDEVESGAAAITSPLEDIRVKIPILNYDTLLKEDNTVCEAFVLFFTQNEHASFDKLCDDVLEKEYY